MVVWSGFQGVGSVAAPDGPLLAVAVGAGFVFCKGFHLWGSTACGGLSRWTYYTFFAGQQASLYALVYSRFDCVSVFACGLLSECPECEGAIASDGVGAPVDPVF